MLEVKAVLVLRDYLGLQQQHKTVLKHLAHEMNWHHDSLDIMTQLTTTRSQDLVFSFLRI